VPFKPGEEVLVDIVEPHMYEADDAVAKIDGYIVSVRGAVKLIGSRRLVRIVEAGRTAAISELVDPADISEAGVGADGVESKPRRRGRRGGRRRSAATADSASES
jgi:ribonuclease G